MIRRSPSPVLQHVVEPLVLHIETIMCHIGVTAHLSAAARSSFISSLIQESSTWESARADSPCIVPSLRDASTAFVVYALSLMAGFS